MQLCEVLNILDIDNYDLSCFNINSCGPKDFEELINFLINRVCALEGITPTTENSGSACPVDCIVSVAPCLITNGQSSLNLVDYVNLIANTICDLVSQISVINNTLEINDKLWDPLSIITYVYKENTYSFDIIKL
jgi:hypothetical protein